MKPDFIELTHDELGRVAGGFLPLLGLIGMGASLGGKITGMIGQAKAKKAEKINAETEAEAQAAGLGQGGEEQAAPQRGAGNMMGEGAVAQKRGTS